MIITTLDNMKNFLGKNFEKHRSLLDRIFDSEQCLYKGNKMGVLPMIDVFMDYSLTEAYMLLNGIDNSKYNNDIYALIMADILESVRAFHANNEDYFLVEKAIVSYRSGTYSNEKVLLPQSYFIDSFIDIPTGAWQMTICNAQIKGEDSRFAANIQTEKQREILKKFLLRDYNQSIIKGLSLELRAGDHIKYSIQDKEYSGVVCETPESAESIFPIIITDDISGNIILTSKDNCKLWGEFA